MTTISIILSFPEKLSKEILLLQKNLKTKIDNVTENENEFHITLAYGDDVPEESVKPLTEELSTILNKINIPVKLGPLNSLTNPKNEGVIYIDVASPELHQLNADVVKVMEKVGAKFTFPEYKPHVTLFYLSEPVTTEQKELMDSVEFSASYAFTPADAKVSKKVADEWVRLAYSLSKRWQLKILATGLNA